MLIEVPNDIEQPKSVEIDCCEVSVSYGHKRVVVESDGFTVDYTFVSYEEVAFYAAISKQIREGGL